MLWCFGFLWLPFMQARRCGAACATRDLPIRWSAVCVSQGQPFTVSAELELVRRRNESEIPIYGSESLRVVFVAPSRLLSLRPVRSCHCYLPPTRQHAILLYHSIL